MPHPLDGAHRKLDRAEAHFGEANTAVERFLDSNPYGYRGHFDEGGFNYFARWKVREHPGDEVGLIIGDFAHNARSALDHLVFQLAKLTRPNPKRTQFPIFLDAGEYRGQARRMLGGVGKEHRTAIERLQPYHGPQPLGSALFLLSEMNNIDKHRVLHVVGGSPRDVSVGLPVDLPAGMKTTISTVGLDFIEDEAPICIVFFSERPPPDVNVEIRPRIEIRFGPDSERLAAHSVGRTMEFIVQRVRQILRDFDDQFTAT